MSSSHNSSKIIEVNKRIAALGASRKLAQALALFRGIAGQGLKPTIVSYNVILYACIRCGDMATANTIFAELMAPIRAARGTDLPDTAVVPTVVTYTTMLKGLCQNGDMLAAEYLVGDMQRQGITPNLRTVNMFLRGCLWHGFAEEALSCYGHLGDWSLTPDRVSVDYTVRTLAASLRIKEACAILEDMPNFVRVRPVTLDVLAPPWVMRLSLPRVPSGRA